MQKKILFADSNHPALHEILMEKGFQCDLFWDKPIEELIRLIPAYHGIVIRSRFLITKEIIDTATLLECIGRAGAGMENIDVAYAGKKGIVCVHAPEGNRDAVAEQAMAMLLGLFNNINRADREVRQGKWFREQNRGEELKGKTVGIIGYGNMGSAFAERLRGFSCKVLAYDKYKSGFGNEYIKESTLQGLFEETDVISLHTPLTEETRYLLNDAFFNSFRKNIYVINTARGKCLNTADLVKNLQSGKVKGACLDVLEYEAVSFEHIDAAQLPEPFKYLIASDKVILTPHIAGWTQESNEKIATVLANKMAEVLAAD
ncbi:MAG: hydroxyacid dehydrogenase [Bacteroidetes bacterium]|jgi:D-3-phosphoglycerate dehydrogenase|nr:hydroxyacid dehydrogenase [Bacteroidota bacterium]